MKRSTFLKAALLSSTLALAACKDAAEKTGPANATPGAAAPAQAVSVEAIAAQAKGFTVGAAMSARTVYVFFDPQCPHCAVLWESAKPLKSQAKFVWIPVGILNGASGPQGAALLASADPARAMDEHEASMRTKQGGIKTAGDVSAQMEWVVANTKLFDKFGFGSVPAVVGTHAQSGAMVKQEGAMPTAALAALLGLQPPAGN